MNYVLNRAKELEQELIAMRRELHSYAELGFDSAQDERLRH